MKFKELKLKGEAELKALLKDLKSQAQDLALKTRLNQLKNTAQLKQVRKDIARVMTYLHGKHQ